MWGIKIERLRSLNSYCLYRVLISDLDDLVLDFLDIRKEINIFCCFSLAILSFVIIPDEFNTD